MKLRFFMIAGLVCISLSGCMSKVSQKVPQDGVMTRNEVTFPDMNDSWRDAVASMSVENLQKVGVGMNKDEIASIIGYPHFAEGLYHVVEWDYVFNLKKTASDADKICQFKVVFDNKMIARSIFDKPLGCSGGKVSKKYELQSDLLFAFASATLSLKGKETVANIAKSENISSVIITGHTDMIGSEASNLTLSKKRAEAVKKELVANGVSVSDIVVNGVGESEPIKSCDTRLARAELIECLAPNRRVTIEINPAK
ncbi:MAG: OmpA family protein [Campylobacter sp.]|nr:OmpA family protein [Campylobacter sp.]